MRTQRAAAFVVSRWVRGERFYGRQAQIAEILDGPRDCLWLLGTRRSGKTSLLRHLELLAERSPERGYVPVFWDIRAAHGLAGLSRAFHAALSAGRLARLELSSSDVEAEDLCTSLARVRRRLRSRGRRLLLLCDDAEALVRLRDEEPALLRKLGRALQAGEDARTVLASTLRLRALAEPQGEASPFLHGFVPPLYLQALADEEARALIAQAQLLGAVRPAFGDDSAALLIEYSGGHPYLLQMLCRRALELGGVEQAFQQIAADGRVSAPFLSDLDSLPDADLAVLAALAEHAPADAGRLQARCSLDAGTLKESLFRLENLGLVRGDEQRRFTLANRVLRHWLAAGGRRPTRPPATPAAALVADSSRADRPAASSPGELFQAVYDPLRQLARRYFRRERPEHTLQPTALVHEAYLKLAGQSRADWKGRTHFFAVGAKVMRRILIDHARSRRRAKRGGDWLRVTLSGVRGSPVGRALDAAELLALHAALQELARRDARQARVVELRFFGGLTSLEVAEALGVSKRTADDDWAKARVWLERELAGR